MVCNLIYSGKKAFTLIELLVVIAIISLLVSILMPSLNKAKDLAKKTVCGNTMRSIGISIIMYTNDYDGWIPKVRDSYSPLKDFWSDKIYNEYLPNADAFCCPSAPERVFSPNEVEGSIKIAYGLEWWLGGGANIQGKGNRLVDIENNSCTVLLGENGSLNHGYGVHNYCFPVPNASDWGWIDDNRHNGISNILFLDTHASSYSSDEALDPDNSNVIWFVIYY